MKELLLQDPDFNDTGFGFLSELDLSSDLDLSFWFGFSDLDRFFGYRILSDFSGHFRLLIQRCKMGTGTGNFFDQGIF